MRIITPFAQLTRSRKMYSTSQSIQHKPKGTARIPVVMNSTSGKPSQPSTRELITNFSREQKWDTLVSLYNDICVRLKTAGYDGSFDSLNEEFAGCKKWFGWKIDRQKASNIHQQLQQLHDRHIQVLNEKLIDLINAKDSLPNDDSRDFTQRRDALNNRRDFDGLARLLRDVSSRQQRVQSERELYQKESQEILTKLSSAAMFYRTFGQGLYNTEATRDIDYLTRFYELNKDPYHNDFKAAKQRIDSSQITISGIEDQLTKDARIIFIDPLNKLIERLESALPDNPTNSVHSSILETRKYIETSIQHKKWDIAKRQKDNLLVGLDPFEKEGKGLRY